MGGRMGPFIENLRWCEQEPCVDAHGPKEIHKEKGE